MKLKLFAIGVLVGLSCSGYGQLGGVEKKTSGSRAESVKDVNANLKVAEDQAQDQKAVFYRNEFMQTRSKAIDVNTKLIPESEQEKLDGIVEKMESEVPATSEYHYVKYINSNYDVAKVDHLHKAYELSSNKAELYDDYIAHYEITQNSTKKAEFCTRLYNSKTVPEGVMDYNYNVLMSLDQNAILFVNGSDDTYPIWMHQNVKGVRKDITILNVDLLGVETYRNQKLSTLGVKSTISYNNDRVGFIKSIAKENPNKPIYFALTLSPAAIKGLKDHLYLTGLALKYSPEPMENIPVLKENWEQKFRVASLDDVHTNSTVKKMNNNYILPVMLLSMNYKAQGNAQQAKRLETLALKLAKEGGKEVQVKQYIQQQE